MSEQPETVPLETGGPRPVDTPVDLGDKAHVEARNKKIKREAILLQQTITQIMSHKNGREFIRWLLEISGVNHNSFAPNALVMSFKTGEQNVGHQILARITQRECIEYYVQMLKEGASPDAS